MQHQEKLEDIVDERTRDLQRKTEELEIANRHKSIFLANMSHELRTPLNSIIGFTNLIIERRSEQLDERVMDALQTVRSNGKRLLSTVNDILDLSKMEAGRMETHMELFNIIPLIKNIILENHIQADEKGLSIRLSLPTTTLSLCSDERLMQQIITNLFSNAIKYTDQGHIKIEAMAHHDANIGDCIVLTISDTGIGISQKDQQTLFEDFRRVAASQVSSVQGTGLGLAIVNRLTSLLGGSLEVNSIPGKGSSFKLTFPTTPATTTALGKMDTPAGNNDNNNRPDTQDSNTDNSNPSPTDQVLNTTESNSPSEYNQAETAEGVTSQTSARTSATIHSIKPS